METQQQEGAARPAVARSVPPLAERPRKKIVLLPTWEIIMEIQNTDNG